jgi:hypothetical protein
MLLCLILFSFFLSTTTAQTLLEGTWTGTQTIVTATGLTTQYPITSLTINATTGVLIDTLACSNKCFIDSTFDNTGTSMAGWYRENSTTAAIHGAWTMFVDNNNQNLLHGLSFSFSSNHSYIISCTRKSPRFLNDGDEKSQNQVEADVSLDGYWDGGEYKITTSGINTTSNWISMNITGKDAFFKDSIGCTTNCFITSDYAYTGYAQIGFYHDTSISGKVHGIWSMNTIGTNGLFALTSSFSSGNTYIVKVPHL